MDHFYNQLPAYWASFFLSLIRSTEKLYKEPAVRAPTLQYLSEIARGLGFDMEESELMEYRGKIACTNRIGVLETVAQFYPLSLTFM